MSLSALPYRRLRWFVVLLVCLLVLVGAFWGAIYYRWALAPRQLRGVGKPLQVTVQEGMSPRSVGEMLEDRQVIRSARVFAYLGRNVTVHPGVYRFSSSDAPTRILRRLSLGDVETVRVTFPEGFTLRQDAGRLHSRGLVADAEAWHNLAATQGQTFHVSFPLGGNLEGYLFPDTYKFPVVEKPDADSERKIAQTMLDTFARVVVEKHKADIAQSGHSLADIVNVAAMIEKEAVTDEDRPKIAGVIYNRLARGMRLEIDATVQYALPAHTSRVLYRDLEVDSPYNTYKIKGLPPGPICNPGLPSLEAAMHPEKSDYLYYVSGRDNKAHLFARTFAEHQQNIARVRGR